MRLKSLLAVAVAMTAFALAAPKPAEATDLAHAVAPAGWGRSQVINHWAYYPRYHHIYRVHASTDPYAYESAPRGYYPYYNSGYWRPASEMRNRHRYNFKLPKYYQAWGYPKRTYAHRAWHEKHHGRHYPWHR